MTAKAQTDIGMRIVVTRPVPGVSYSLQAKDGTPLAAKISREGETLPFDFAIRVGPGPRFFGNQVRREGPQRRFVYLRIGHLAGDLASPWSRRMKIDIHDIDPDLLEQAAQGGVIEIEVIGTGADGTPACATVRATSRRLVDR